MAKQNRKQFVSVVAVVCKVCGGPNGYVRSSDGRPRFREGRRYVSGTCPSCTTLVNRLQDGGAIVMCASCGRFTVTEPRAGVSTLQIAEEIGGVIAKMPDGALRIEIAQCPICKEAAHVENDQA